MGDHFLFTPCIISAARLQLLFFWFFLSLIFFSCVNTNSSTSKSTMFAVGAAEVVAPTMASNETDHLSLLAFKVGIVGDPRRALSSWNETLHFCDGWRGVTCDGRHRQRVVALDLSSLDLSGYISPSITNLTFLRRINLGANRLNGVIPLEISRLFRLRYLNLSSNSLVGEIPSNLSHCFHLQVISLRVNQLTGEIPAGLGSQLPKLRLLSLGTNKLSGVIPPSLGNLSSSHFEILSLGVNKFTGGIPQELGRLSGLFTFSLPDNQLSGMVPTSLYNNLSLIENFDLSTNRLSGTIPADVGITFPNLICFNMYNNMFEGLIPNSISNASFLETFDFSINRFSGTIPDNLGGLKNLNLFSLAINQLEARDVTDWNFLSSLTNCTRLTHLAIFNNELRGVLPSSIANLSKGLGWLMMGDNQISGNIPAGIENLVGLQALSINENHLTGNVPAAMGKLQGLGVLDLSWNRLSGKIPSALGNLTQLSKLFLDQNDLWGSIPTSFRNYKRPQLLDLSNNNLNGTIPDEVFSLFSLSSYLDLSYNFFSGSLPLKVGRLKHLGGLYLSNNKLSGEIPSTLGDCQTLEHLSLDGNFFQGTIPPSIRNLKSIRVLDLSLNNLSGRIPEFLGDFQYLEYLNLSFNNFEGEVPKNGVFRNISAISLNGNNKLCGDVSRLHLTACPVQVHRREKGSHLLRITIIPVVVGFCLLLFFFISTLYWMRKRSRKRPPPMSFLDNKYKKISYGELLKATDGFSSNNLIGVGSFGSVYKGTLDGDSTIVAVKVLNLQRQGASKSFVAECEALKNIRHRNIIKIVTVCSSVDYRGNDFKALIFEFMPNGSLEKWLHLEADVCGQLKTLNFVQRLSIAIDVASALYYLHNHCPTPIVHCDLKPNNIFLDADMNALVGDFGLARFLFEATSNDNSENPSSSIGIKGSVGYVAPEYGMGGTVSTFGDAYSFGILLLEMFTAKNPINDMFKDGLNLRRYVETAFPDQVMDIVDSRLISQEEEAPSRTRNSVSTRERIQWCLVSVMRIGLNCTRELPRERMEMGDVVTEMHKIRGIYLTIRRSIAHQYT